jgi:drug/metabolite transporter (DMT)-like permease
VLKREDVSLRNAADRKKSGSGSNSNPEAIISSSLFMLHLTEVLTAALDMLVVAVMVMEVEVTGMEGEAMATEVEEVLSPDLVAVLAQAISPYQSLAVLLAVFCWATYSVVSSCDLVCFIKYTMYTNV